MFKTARLLVTIVSIAAATVLFTASSVDSSEAAGIFAVAHVIDPIGLSVGDIASSSYISILLAEKSSVSKFFCSVRLPEEGSVYVDVMNSHIKTFSRHLSRHTIDGHIEAGLLMKKQPLPSTSIASSYNDNRSDIIVTICYTEN